MAQGGRPSASTGWGEGERERARERERESKRERAEGGNLHSIHIEVQTIKVMVL